MEMESSNRLSGITEYLDVVRDGAGALRQLLQLREVPIYKNAIVRDDELALRMTLNAIHTAMQQANLAAQCPGDGREVRLQSGVAAIAQLQHLFGPALCGRSGLQALLQIVRQ